MIHAPPKKTWYCMHVTEKSNNFSPALKWPIITFTPWHKYKDIQESEQCIKVAVLTYSLLRSKEIKQFDFGQNKADVKNKSSNKWIKCLMITGNIAMLQEIRKWMFLEGICNHSSLSQ